MMLFLDPPDRNLVRAFPCNLRASFTAGVEDSCASLLEHRCTPSVLDLAPQVEQDIYAATIPFTAPLYEANDRV